MSEIPPKRIEDDEDGAPTSEVPQRSEPRDTAEDTAEAPMMKKSPGSPTATVAQRRSLSKSDKIKLWIILLGPIVFIVLVAGLFLIEVDGETIGVRAWNQIFGVSDSSDTHTGKVQLRKFRDDLEEFKGNISFYHEGLDKLEAEFKGVPNPNRETLLPFLDRAEALVKALQGVNEATSNLKKGIEDYERAGKDVNPSSGDVLAVMKQLEPLLDRSRKLQIEIDTKIWKSNVPPPSDNTPIIESGGGQPPKKEEKKDEPKPDNPK
ncbi:MAG TPA: hypothetical protein VI643_06400 [Planctomycetota bacterium]|nr:hypothetical protein [Planctomycetota bacterium]